MGFLWRLAGNLGFGAFLFLVGNILSIAGDDAWCRMAGLPSGGDGACSDGTLVPAWVEMLSAALLLWGVAIVLAFIVNARSRKLGQYCEIDAGEGVPGDEFSLSRRERTLPRQAASRTGASSKTLSNHHSPHLHDPLVNPLHPLSPLYEEGCDSKSTGRAAGSSRSFDLCTSDSGSSLGDSWSSGDSGGGSSCD